MRGEDALYQACERQSDRWSNLTHRWVYPLGKHHFEQAANGSTRILTLAIRDGFEVSFTVSEDVSPHQFAAFTQEQTTKLTS